MRSTLDSCHYISPDILAREQRFLFRRLWVFAGLRSLLAKPDAYVTRVIGGVPILVQNVGGELRGFVNQCTHRQSPLQHGDYGQRRLACPYHGWVYDHWGRVKSIPGCDTQYGFPQATVAGLRLKSIAVECVGNLIFVNLDAEPLPLDAQFHGSYLRRIEEISAFIDGEAIFARFHGAYNWKLNFENVIDYNHVPFVHASSFAKMIPALRPGSESEMRARPPPPDDEIGGDIRDLSYETQSAFDFPHWPWHDRVERFADAPIYYNFFIYPNVNFISLAGVTFLVQQFNPVTPAETEVMLTLTTARKRRKLPASAAILWSHLRSEKRVINEDIVVLEGLQRGLHDGGAHAFHGSCETRLRAVAKVYRQLLGESDG